MPENKDRGTPTAPPNPSGSTSSTIDAWVGAHVRVILLVLVAIGGLAQLVIVTQSTVGSSNDSVDYRSAAGTPARLIDLSSPAADARVRIPAPIIDVLGNGLRPGFLVQSMYRILPDDGIRVFAQGLVSALTWSLLALTLGYLVERSWSRIAVVAATMFASVSPVITWWNVAIAQESLMLLATLVVLAALITIVFPRVPLAGLRVSPTTRSTVLTIAFVVAVGSRPHAALLLAPLTLGALGLCWFRRDRSKAVALGAVVIVLASGWSVLALANNAERWNDQLAINRFASRMDDPAYLAVARDVGMPKCPDLDQVIRDTKAGRYGDYVTPVVSATRACRELLPWFEGGGVKPQDVLLHDPALFAREFWEELDTLGAHPGIRAKALHGKIAFVAGSEIVRGTLPDLPDPLAPVQEVLWAPAGLAPLVGLLLAMVGVVIGIVRHGLRHFLPELALLGWTVLCVGAYSAIVWSADGMEPTRHALPTQLVLTVVVWVVVLRACGTPARRTEHGQPSAVADPVTAPAHAQ